MLNLNHNKKKGNLNYPDRSFFFPIRLTKNKKFVDTVCGQGCEDTSILPIAYESVS